jgi:small subunit ribosomal protein S15
MARMHARRKGRSGSTHSVDRKTPPSWSSLNPREVESRIIELAKAGNSTSRIGMVLRDQYAVPDIKLSTGKKVSRILNENKLSTEFPENLRDLISTALNLRKHLNVHKKDIKNKRNLQLTESKIRRLTKYYHSKNMLPTGWKYTPGQAKLMFE